MVLGGGALGSQASSCHPCSLALRPSCWHHWSCARWFPSPINHQQLFKSSNKYFGFELQKKVECEIGSIVWRGNQAARSTQINVTMMRLFILFCQVWCHFTSYMYSHTDYSGVYRGLCYIRACHFRYLLRCVTIINGFWKQDRRTCYPEGTWTTSRGLRGAYMIVIQSPQRSIPQRGRGKEGQSEYPWNNLSPIKRWKIAFLLFVRNNVSGNIMRTKCVPYFSKNTGQSVIVCCAYVCSSSIAPRPPRLEEDEK